MQFVQIAIGIQIVMIDLGLLTQQCLLLHLINDVNFALADCLVVLISHPSGTAGGPGCFRRKLFADQPFVLKAVSGGH